MGSKTLLLFFISLAIVLAITSQVVARELAEASTSVDNSETLNHRPDYEGGGRPAYGAPGGGGQGGDPGGWHRDGGYGGGEPRGPVGNPGGGWHRDGGYGGGGGGRYGGYPGQAVDAEP
ncbi:unnamed protein product [Coffea canephora]|uniref:DH200=94 genomic scaffold, scaffold_909 n=1 Tax=Coffea canephora TaxID=49390 RepID=A0A068VHB9_COFCA|nr:unnamed protein product [Coffea canephora]